MIDVHTRVQTVRSARASQSQLDTLDRLMETIDREMGSQAWPAHGSVCVFLTIFPVLLMPCCCLCFAASLLHRLSRLVSLLDRLLSVFLHVSPQWGARHQPRRLSSRKKERAKGKAKAKGEESERSIFNDLQGQAPFALFAYFCGRWLAYFYLRSISRDTDMKRQDLGRRQGDDLRRNLGIRSCLLLS